MTTTHINDLFDQMEPEDGNELDKKIKVEGDETSKELFEILKKSMIEGQHYPLPNLYLNDNITLFVDKTYSSKNIRDISLMANQDMFHIFNSKISYGLFLSYLIENSTDENYEIVTKHLESKLSEIGRKNNKNLKITGDLGTSSFSYMSDGSAVVNGNVTGKLGFGATGKEIIVKGDAINTSLLGLRGVNITIEGKFTGAIQMVSNNTEIYLNEADYKIKESGRFFGKVYEKGKLVYEDGEYK